MEVEILTLLMQIANAVRSTLDLCEVLQTSVMQLGQALSVDRCFIRLADDQSGLPVVSEYVAKGALSVSTLGPLPPSLIMTTGKGSVIPDLWLEPALTAEAQHQKELLGRLGTRASMAAPIVVGGTVIGVIAVHDCRGPRQWQEGEIFLLEQMGVQAGVAIALAQSHQALQKRYAELEYHQKALQSSEERLAGLLEILPNAILMIDRDSRIVYFNRAATQVFGYSESEAQEMFLDQLLPGRMGTRHRALVARFAASPDPIRRLSARSEYAGRRKDGSIFPAEIAVSKFTLAGETFFTAIVQDITQRKETERTLRESEERFRNAFENAPIGVAILDCERRCLQTNQALTEMLGYAEAELRGLTLESLEHPDGRETARRQLADLSAGKVSAARLEMRLHHRTGEPVWVLQSISRLPKADGSDHFIAQIQDITDRKRYETNLLHLADHDPLTDLFNRRRFEQELEAMLALSRRYPVHGAVCFLDLDHFKYINDSMGHRVGDELLRSVAMLLRSALRETDIIARLGGDEFALLLPYAGKEEAVALAERVLDGLRHLQGAAGGRNITVTGSIGITFFPAYGGTAETLLAQADVAMYRAKEQGRNSQALFAGEAGWREELASKLTWENRIREALAENRFVLHRQPILDLRTGGVTHFELLIRMVERTGELIMPSAFLGVAERFGLIQEIDRWVVREAIRLMARHRSTGHDHVFAVNLSGRTITDPDLLDLVKAELNRTGVNPANLVFEITETAAIGDTDQAHRFINAMKCLGCRFALDDVGSGFSSLTLIKHLPVEYIKIDGSFVRNLARDRVDQHLVMALVAVAQELGQKTVAEFVDSQETLALLKQYGVDYAQGYLIGKPGPMV
ncbi:MAG TPA: EAL domain-containing protein [Symbiobacteriaceae bacterium]|nr:EAL domain-containing protein [Symbiobacteriaceae bacterium]